MSINNKPESYVDSLTNESARQRWQLFHRAIAHAKQSNNAALADDDKYSADVDRSETQLSVIR